MTADGLRLRTRFIVTAIALALTSSLAGCGSDTDGADGNPDGSSSASDPAEITVQLAGEPDEVAAFELIIDAFEKDNADIDVTLDAIAEKSDHLTKLVTAFAGGTPPDVFLVNYREYAQFAVRGAMLPADRSGLADFYPVAVDAFEYDGELQCVPQNASSLVVYWNRAIFDAAGIDPPADGWTWDDFRSTAAVLTGEGLRGVGIESSLPRLAPFVWSAGGEIVDDENAPTQLTLDTPEARSALGLFVAMARDDESIPTEAEITALGIEEQFAAGRLAMMLDSRRATPALREIRDLDWDVAALPSGGTPVSILHSDGYCIAAETDEPDATRRLVEFATSEAGQTIAALAGRVVPVIPSVAEGAFLDPTALPEHDQVFLDAIPTLRRMPVIATWPEIEDVVEQVLIKVFYETDYTIDDGLAEIAERTQPLFDEAARGVTLLVEGLRKDFRARRRQVAALAGVDLAVGDGEISAIIGPSGSGKTTLLRAIAGLERVDGGRIEIGERDVTALEPGARNVAMVFQDHALYPHMRLAANVGFALKARRTPRDEAHRHVGDALALLDIGHLAERFPREVSGGERQRAALARAIVREPAIFLLDEPLSSLDPALRGQARRDLRTLQRRLGTTMLYVTHDHVEAMSMSDRLGVLRNGVIEQLDEPLAVYDRPASVFVAQLLGTPSINLVPGDVFRATLARPPARPVGGAPASAATYGLRPERIRIAPASSESSPTTDRPNGNHHVVRARVIDRSDLGSDAVVTVESAATTLVARVARIDAAALGSHIVGAEVVASFADADILHFDAAGLACA